MNSARLKLFNLFNRRPKSAAWLIHPLDPTSLRPIPELENTQIPVIPMNPKIIQTLRGAMTANKAPPSRVEAMYAPEMFGEVPNARVKVEAAK